MASVETRQRDDRFEIMLNRPEVRNALNLDALNELVAALDASRSARGRAVVLTGAGDAFCAGGDIQDMVARKGKAFATYERLRTGLLAIADKVLHHPKPVIARLAGDAVGAGAAIAAASDIVVALDTARIGFPFVKVGLVPDTAASWILPRLVGLQAARRLLLTGDLIDAGTAQRLGLVTEVASDARGLDDAVDRWCTTFARIPPGAMADTKRLVAANLSAPFANAVQQEALVQGLRFTTEEHARAVEAFLQKRKGSS